MTFLDLLTCFLFMFKITININHGTQMGSSDRNIDDISRSSSDSESYPSNCLSLEDGTYTMQLIDDPDYPRVQIKCRNGYAILDYNFDSNIESYFTSWQYWHRATVGPSSNEIPNWREWYLPEGGLSSQFHNYLISPDCDTCQYVDNRQLYSEQSTYWMTGSFFGCYWRVKANANCDMDYNTLECYTCLTDDRYINDVTDDTTQLITDKSSSLDYEYTGLCSHNVRPAAYYKPESQEQCTTSRTDLLKNSQNLKPSLGTNGQYCVCTQPVTVKHTEYYTIDTQEEEDETDTSKTEKTNSNQKFLENSETNEEEEEETRIIELWQKDFEDGTYRIKTSGYYKIMEDIVFDFNPSNDYVSDAFAYWPLISQSDEYPGAQDYRDEYSFGFFAGITVEADDVELDLNLHKLSMSKFFYLQQPWFTVIELSQQYFLPGQSFGFFGANPHLSSHVVIKNGILGLSSHHGIHGNSNHDIELRNLRIRDFNTHGIQLNGFTNLVMKNVDIGPSSVESYFRGQWGISRVLRRRWQHIAEETVGETIIFDGRDSKQVSMQDIVDDLTESMDTSWDYVINKYDIKNDGTTEDRNADNDFDVDSYDVTNDLFVNPDGIPSAASIYGIFLNKFGASVFTYNLYSKDHSSTAYLEDIKIHGLTHTMEEWPYLIVTSYLSDDEAISATDEIKNPFFGPISVKDLFNEYPDFGDGYPSYRGNILTDGYIASTKFLNSKINSFKYLGQQCVLNDMLVEWATMSKSDETTGIGVGSTDNIRTRTLGESIRIGCNMDTMNHAGKGTLGLRIDSVDNVIINNIEIYNNHDRAPLGTDACGNYDETSINSNGFTVEKGGHFRQTEPMQVGFSGNMNQGIAITASESVTMQGDIIINDLTSETGAVIGIAIWPNVDIIFKNANINIKNLEAGGNVDIFKYEYSDRPNKAPEVCGLLFYEEYGDYTSSMYIAEDSSIDLACFAGDVGCLGEINQFAHEMIDFDNSKINDINGEQECPFRFENSDTRIGVQQLEIAKQLDIVSNNNNENKENDAISTLFLQIIWMVVGITVLVSWCLVVRCVWCEKPAKNSNNNGMNSRDNNSTNNNNNNSNSKAYRTI